MSGHSKWSNIKRKKGAEDAKKGKIFGKLNKEITVAARMGGVDPEGNSRLRAAIADAKAANMPKENIERAIKKGSGTQDVEVYEEIVYEGYGPGGVAVLVDCLTDNKNRTVGEVRYLFSKYGGNLGESGCVAWMFDKKGSIYVDRGAAHEEKLMEVALEAGAEDIVEEDSGFQVITDPEDLSDVRETLESEEISFLEASVSMIPRNYVAITDEKKAVQIIKLLDVLEDCDDVQKVHSNFDIPDEVMEKISS
ncbi:MAG: YebC/PmpR family DNA-binding transcriptional regulator [Thermodesulfobacteriota bacterium]